MKIINEFEEIIFWPKKRLDKDYVIQFLATKFEIDREYSEKEVNKIIDNYHMFNDIALLRRELISRKILSRTDNGSKYWKNNLDSI